MRFKLLIAAGLGLSLASLAPGQETKSRRDEVITSELADTPVRLLFVDRHSMAFDRGGVLQLVVEEGETVKKDQTVAELKDQIPEAALAVAEARVANDAEVVSADKQREAAQFEFESARKANETAKARNPNARPIYEESALNKLRLGAEAAAAEVEKARKEYAVNTRTRDQAKAELDSYRIKSPRNGIVTRVFKREGEGAGAAETVVEILSTDRIRVEAEVEAATAWKLRTGQTIDVVVTFPGEGDMTRIERFRTTLKFVDPALERVSQTVRVWADLDNTKGLLREGLRTQIEIIKESPTTESAKAP
jgi:multidrug resistance efflux pump